MPNRFVLKGGAEMSANLTKLIKQFPRKGVQAIKEELEIEKKESQRRTPVLTGELRASHNVPEPQINGNRIVGEIEVTAPYAIPVHENTSAFHRNGQAKFLESTLFESRPFLGARIARRLDLATNKWGF